MEENDDGKRHLVGPDEDRPAASLVHHPDAVVHSFVAAATDCPLLDGLALRPLHVPRPGLLGPTFLRLVLSNLAFRARIFNRYAISLTEPNAICCRSSVQRFEHPQKSGGQLFQPSPYY